MLWLREYAVPLAVTTILHMVLLFWMASDFSSESRTPLVKQPKHIKASLVQIKEKKKPKPKIKKKPKPVVKKKPKPKPKVKPKTDPKVIAARKKKEQEKEKQKKLEEQKKLEQERLEKQQQEEKMLQEEALLNSMEEEELFEENAEDEVTAMSYMSVIRSAVESNWSRPPSARNGMQVLLDIELVPTGAVINVNVAKSSGNEAFDRSAVTAVEKAERFPELTELESRVFEKYYRHFKLIFKPEDLRL